MFALKTMRSRLSLFLAASLIASAAFAQTSPEAIRNYNQGMEAYQQGKPTEAIKKFQRATEIDPNYADAYYNIGSLYYQMKQYESAREMFQKAVNLRPTDTQAKYNLALALEKLSRTEEALSILSQIPPSDPKYAQAKAKIEELKPALKPAAPAPVVDKPTLQVFSRGYDGPTGITIGPGGFMYVANYTKNQIYKVGANGDKTVFAQGELLKGPIGLVYNPKNNELYVANYLLNNVVRINASGKASVLATGIGKPYNLYLDTVNNALYVSEQEHNAISRILLPR